MNPWRPQRAAPAWKAPSRSPLESCPVRRLRFLLNRSPIWKNANPVANPQPEAKPNSRNPNPLNKKLASFLHFPLPRIPLAPKPVQATVPNTVTHPLAGCRAVESSRAC
jgi:hypothetical protein